MFVLPDLTSSSKRTATATRRNDRLYRLFRSRTRSTVTRNRSSAVAPPISLTYACTKSACKLLRARANWRYVCRIISPPFLLVVSVTRSTRRFAACSCLLVLAESGIISCTLSTPPYNVSTSATSSLQSLLLFSVQSSPLAPLSAALSALRTLCDWLNTSLPRVARSHSL